MSTPLPAGNGWEAAVDNAFFLQCWDWKPWDTGEEDYSEYKTFQREELG